jgi:NTP pyrophosphatase (non-canonical NTP hydrolase)
MTFEEYQKFVEKYLINKNSGLAYPALGLCGEAGEVAEKVKKIIRDKNGEIAGSEDELVKELGDVLWYAARLSMELGVTLETVAEKNVEKLKGRMERGTVQGNGDER